MDFPDNDYFNEKSAIMAAYMNMDTLRFQLFDVHRLGDLLRRDRFREFDEDAINIFLDSIKDFSDQELYPCYREMDEEPARYEDGGIVVHPQVKVLMEKSAESGLIGGAFDLEDGGMQLPGMAQQAAYFIMESANNNAPGYPGLTAGAARLIVSFGSEELKEQFIPQMLSGEWGGTMCLTEPQAGSSLSDITTTAYPQEDGTYLIKGQKIFISGGDHAYCNNFVHLVLARIEGAPAGTKGISLFVVPKKRMENGELIANDVQTAGDFQKMGQRGYCTTHLAFGENDDARAWLVGEAHRGLSYMFQMMNDARISVGRGGVSVASAAYHAALQYAGERPQGRRLSNSGKKDPSVEPVPIMQHADVRRMLLLQKAIYEGALSLVLQSSRYHDLEMSGTEEERKHYNQLLELLTPVAKTYPSEKGREAVDNGLQVLGGYGFCSDFVLQQYYRDIRIMAIYEGTTGIQSLDLLGRKITMNDGKALKLLMAEISQTVEEAGVYDILKPYASELGDSLQQLEQVLKFLLPFAKRGEYERFLADATIFMEFFGTIIVAWQWLKMGIAAKQALIKGDSTYSTAFYESKIHTMRFFFKYELRKAHGLADVITSEEVLTLAEEKELIE